MTILRYVVRSELKTPWFLPPYINFQLYKVYAVTKTDFSGWVDEYTAEKCLYSSPDEDMIVQLANKLNTTLEHLK